MSQWGWSPAPNLGIWRYGVGWIRPIMAAIPCLTVGLLLLMFYFLDGALTSQEGVLFDLPECTVADGERPRLTALVMPVGRETVVFFDETRYLLGDESSVRNLSDDLAACVERSEKKSVLLLADRRVPVSDLMNVMSVAKKSGADRVLVAGRRPGGDE